MSLFNIVSHYFSKPVVCISFNKRYFSYDPSIDIFAAIYHINCYNNNYHTVVFVRVRYVIKLINC